MIYCENVVDFSKIKCHKLEENDFFFFIVLFIHFISFVFCPNFISFHPVQSPLKSLNTPTTQAPLLGVFMGRSRLGAQLAHDLI